MNIRHEIGGWADLVHPSAIESAEAAWLYSREGGRFPSVGGSVHENEPRRPRYAPARQGAHQVCTPKPAEGQQKDRFAFAIHRQPPVQPDKPGSGSHGGRARGLGNQRS